ncbi:MAG TPA: stage III sporulation protein AE [Ruminiclostridium sp.]|jgi:stage III sporulation protein AE|nr:stage III sporulation protein AE [Ruminiclostridium sp.]
MCSGAHSAYSFNILSAVLRKKLIIVLIVFAVFAFPVVCAAEDNEMMMDSIIKRQLEGSEVKKLEKNLEENITDEAKELFPQYSPGKLMEELVKGNVGETVKSLPKAAIDTVIGEIRQNFGLILKLIMIIFLTAMVKNLQSSFAESAVGELAYFSCYGAIVTMIALGFQTVLQYAREVLDTIDKITGFAVPALLALLISSGNIVSGSALQPVLLFAIQGTVKILRDVFLPLCLLSGILYIVSGLSDRIKITGMADLIKQIVAWGLAGVLTVYGSAAMIQGAVGGTIDGAVSKTAKTAISTIIPVAGKYMADAADTILSCALVIKNAAGIATMIITLAVCIIPVLKILAIALLYQFAAAIVEPFAEERLYDCLSDISDCIKTIVGIVGAALFMFLLSVGTLLSAGGISGMMQ